MTEIGQVIVWGKDHAVVATVQPDARFGGWLARCHDCSKVWSNHVSPEEALVVLAEHRARGC